MKLISFILIELLLGIIIGLAGGFLFVGIKNKNQKKNAAKNIEKQDLKKGENKTPINFYKKLPKTKKPEKTEKIVAQNGSMKIKKEKKLVKEDKKDKKLKKEEIKKIKPKKKRVKKK